MNALDLVHNLQERFKEGVLQHITFRDEETLSVHPDRVKELLRYCRDELRFDYLVDICSVDHPEREPRFDVVYELYSYATRIHLRVKTTCSEETPEVATMSDLWQTANWHEREIWDMMGIRFTNHPDLRRILMWEGYPFHPLRKEFPLGGKASDVPEVAFTSSAALEGGPFVTRPTTGGPTEREPRAKGEK